MSYKMKLNITTIIFAIVCFTITLISPRFGYGFHGMNDQYADSPFFYVSTQKHNRSRKDIYKNREGTPMSLEYQSRFLGKRTWTYDNQQPEIATVMIDGATTDVSNRITSSPAVYSAYDVMRYDSGGFFLFAYLFPFGLILLFRFLHPKIKAKSNRIATIVSIVLLTFAIAYAARFNTLLVAI